MSQITFFGTGGGGGGTVITLSGNTGGPIGPDGAGNISVPGGHNVNSAGGGNTITFALNNAIVLGDLTPIAPGSDAITAQTGNVNIEAGDLKLPLSYSDGGRILSNGQLFLHNFGTTSPGNNLFLGLNSGNTTLTTANQNVFLGASSGSSVTTAEFNLCAGFGSGSTMVDGVNNVWLGAYSGQTANGSEQSTIYIGSQITTNVAGEINVCRIGNETNNGPGDLLQTFIQGIAGITPAGVGLQPVFIDNTGQLGTGGGTVVTGIDGDTGGLQAGNVTVSGGTTGLSFNSGGSAVTASFAGITANGGTVNLATDATTSSLNIGSGLGAKTIGIGSNTTTTAITLNSGSGGVTIHGNTGAVSITSAAASPASIHLQVTGLGGTITLTGATVIPNAFGATIGLSGTALLIDNTGALGTVASSIRYKENIYDMNHSSSSVMDLRPVIFNYKKDEAKSLCYGLIAEEVEEIFPDLVSYNAKGEVETVRYHDLPVLLLNELKKQNEMIKRLHMRVLALENLENKE